MRADRYISEVLKLFSRSQHKQRNVRIILNGKEIKPGKTVRCGDSLEVHYTEPEETLLLPEALPLEIIHEDSLTAVINKPQGMVVHPAAGNRSGTLMNGLLHHFRLNPENFRETGFRSGIVHRLDKETSGVIITAKTPEALEFLSLQFRERRVEKHYLALVKGVPVKRKGRIDTHIIRDSRNRKKFMCTEGGGKRAVTDFEVLKSWNGISLLLMKPLTGRTHQLRVHAFSIGHPILGDPVYGRKSKHFHEATLMLHACTLKIILPGAEEPALFRAPLPDRFKKIISAASGNTSGKEISEKLESFEQF